MFSEVLVQLVAEEKSISIFIKQMKDNAVVIQPLERSHRSMLIS